MTDFQTQHAAAVARLTDLNCTFPTDCNEDQESHALAQQIDLSETQRPELANEESENALFSHRSESCRW